MGIILFILAAGILAMGYVIGYTAGYKDCENNFKVH